ncbi:prepilin peptidase [Pseudoduganella ginsengisoli]|uniref:Prepilin peptidase n=1 Tax=Pseudoduganella ginsengisoli TaxID=1462440 RepID=A0A6L6Q1G0_9BURK|nr:prepilin peptidase [Pseudoduganella ginsengisoli]MTW03475.1 prepilin peptidase [Pseudoduganella ginsengisoli]
MLNVFEFALLWLVMQAAVTDLAVRKVPNVLVLSGVLLALVLHCRLGPDGAWLSAWLGGLAAGFFLFLPMYVGGGMAAGDVKLMAMVGAFAGPSLACDIAMASILAGGVLGLVLIAASGRGRQCFANVKLLLAALMARLSGVRVPLPVLSGGASVGGMPYGVAVAIGTAATLWSHHGMP